MVIPQDLPDINGGDTNNHIKVARNRGKTEDPKHFGLRKMIADNHNTQSDQVKKKLRSDICIVKEKLHRQKKKLVSIKDISFNQDDNIINSSSFKVKATLNHIHARFDGLCEICCNYVLINGLLGKGKSKNFLRKQINVNNLDTDQITKSHLMDVYGVFERIRAYLLGVYPDNILPLSQQKLLIKKQKSGRRVVNNKVFKKGLDEIDNNEVLKFEVFKKKGFSFTGHSLLIKKTGNDKFIFFNPDTGEHRDLIFDQLIEKINDVIKGVKGRDVYLLKGSEYLKRLKEKGLVE